MVGTDRRFGRPFLLGLKAYTGWPLTVALKHLVAFTHCKSAEFVELSNAARGDPGYWERHDQDSDGVVCE